MNKRFKKILTASSVLLMLAGVGAESAAASAHADSMEPYFEQYCGKTKRGVWGYTKWNGNDAGQGGRLYHRTYIHAGTRIYGEHDASRIGFNHYISAYRTNHATKDTYIPKFAFKAVHHHKRVVKRHHTKRNIRKNTRRNTRRRSTKRHHKVVRRHRRR